MSWAGEIYGVLYPNSSNELEWSEKQRALRIAEVVALGLVRSDVAHEI
ncbi:MAG: hypothetical protein AAFQ82_12685 [Myxococcota bacterium]